MAPDQHDPSTNANPFMHLWGEWMKAMASAGSTPVSPSQETLALMQNTFMDAMTQQADQFLRSEAFLGAMKQAMDNSLAWQKAFNELLQQGLGAAQIPTRADADHLVTLVRGLEERIVEKIEDLSGRVHNLEQRERKPS